MAKAWIQHSAGLPISIALSRSDEISPVTEVIVTNEPAMPPEARETRKVIDSFNQMFNQHDARFDAEEIILADDRAVVRWVYRKIQNGQPWHLRGVDIFTVRDGRVAVKLAYVKG